MAEESRQIRVDDLKIYSDGLTTALKQDKLAEARDYVGRMKSVLDSVSRYVEAHIPFTTAR